MSHKDRLERNAESKITAEHDGEIWDQAELELLLTWDRTDGELDVMAEILGRTREACRERFYKEQRQPVKTVTVKKTTTTETTTNFYANWDPEDVSPWYK